MAKANIENAQRKYKFWADKHRTKPPDVEVGQHVWLLRRNIVTARPSDKLDSKKLGPFRIAERIGPLAYRLSLPASMKIHPVFHVSLLEKHTPSRLRSREQPIVMDPVVVGQETFYPVEKILNSRITRQGALEYLVHWHGYPIADRSWMLSSDLDDWDPLVIDFHTRHPDKPGYYRIDRSRRTRA